MAAFLRASLKGWDYALDHVEESSRLIHQNYGSAKDPEALTQEARAMEELILHKFVPVGSMNPGRWRHIADTYASLGSLGKDFSLTGFLYNPTPPRMDPRIVRLIVACGLLAAFLALAYIYILRRFNRSLALQVRTRTRNLEEVNATLAREVEAGKAKEESLARNLAERELLLREIHHRVKNNLQVIASLISLEMADIDSTYGAESLANIRTRVLSMSLAHEQIYSSESLALIDMDSYFRDLASEIVLTTAPRGLQVSVLTRTGRVRLSLDEVIPLGLIVGELLTNCVKHAFPQGGRGEIELSLEPIAAQDEPRRLRLLVSDTGCGGSGAETKGIGLQLVESLSIQLGGRLETRIAKGRQVSLEFSPGSRGSET